MRILLLVHGFNSLPLVWEPDSVLPSAAMSQTMPELTRLEPH